MQFLSNKSVFQKQRHQGLNSFTLSPTLACFAFRIPLAALRSRSLGSCFSDTTTYTDQISIPVQSRSLWLCTILLSVFWTKTVSERVKQARAQRNAVLTATFYPHDNRHSIQSLSRTSRITELGVRASVLLELVILVSSFVVLLRTIRRLACRMIGVGSHCTRRLPVSFESDRQKRTYRGRYVCLSFLGVKLSNEMQTFDWNLRKGSIPVGSFLVI